MYPSKLYKICRFKQILIIIFVSFLSFFFFIQFMQMELVDEENGSIDNNSRVIYRIPLSDVTRIFTFNLIRISFLFIHFISIKIDDDTTYERYVSFTIDFLSNLQF